MTEGEKNLKKRPKPSFNQETNSPVSDSMNPEERKRIKSLLKSNQNRKLNWLVDEFDDENLEDSFASSSSMPQLGGRVSKIISGLDEASPINSLIELNDFLNMAPEDGVFGFPAEAAVRSLISLIEKEESLNSDDDPVTRTLLAARCLTAALDASPRTSSALVSEPDALEMLHSK